MWTPDHDLTVDTFIADTSEQILLLYIDEQSGLTICSTLPPIKLEEVAYFARNDNSEITHGNFLHTVQFGTVHGAYVDGMLRAMHDLYAPTFFENETWPDSILYIYHSLLLLYFVTICMCINHRILCLLPNPDPINRNFICSMICYAPPHSYVSCGRRDL